MRSLLAVIVLASVIAAPADAAITVLAQYRLGEADPGAAPGLLGANPTVASVGTSGLARIGEPSYGLPRPPFQNSTLAMAFDGADDRYDLSAVLTTATDNFGIEAWVKSNGRTTQNALIAYNGNTASSGWGLFRAGAEYGFLYGGVVLDGVVPVTTDWTHLALVREGGTNRFYVNGQLIQSSPGGPNVPVGRFQLGGNLLVPTEGFDGEIDEVRVFTFAPGAFTPADLNLPVFLPPEPIPATQPWSLLLMALGLLASGVLLLRAQRP
jgi:hypothetical protein